MKIRNLLRLATAASAAFLLTLMATPASAGDGTSPNGKPGTGTPSPSSGSDDVEGIPMVIANPVGFEVEIDSWRLNHFLNGVRGQGRVQLRPTRPGKVLVQFTGTFEIQLPTTYLRSRNMRVRYNGARDQMRVVQHAGRMVLMQR